jgi:hypothetical protein
MKGFDEPLPCSRKALWKIGKHSLCLRHAQIVAFDLLVEQGEVHRLNIFKHKSSLTFLKDA